MSTNFNGFVGWYIVCEQPLLYKVKVSEQGCSKCDMHMDVKFCSSCGTRTKEIEIVKDEYHSIYDIEQQSAFSKREKSIFRKVVVEVADFNNNAIVLLLKGISLDDSDEGYEELIDQNFFSQCKNDYRKLRPILKQLYHKTKLCFGKVSYSR